MEDYNRKIILVFLNRREESTLDEDIAWICKVLGFADDEKDLATFIFKEILTASRTLQGVTSKEIADKTRVTQAAIIYHLNLFMRSGIVVKNGRLYALRAPTLDESLEELEMEMVNRIRKIRTVAKRIDGSI